jgi:hypothetical protein
MAGYHKREGCQRPVYAQVTACKLLNVQDSRNLRKQRRCA